jgi:hypothetical protein
MDGRLLADRLEGERRPEALLGQLLSFSGVATAQKLRDPR